MTRLLIVDLSREDDDALSPLLHIPSEVRGLSERWLGNNQPNPVSAYRMPSSVLGPVPVPLISKLDNPSTH